MRGAFVVVVACACGARTELAGTAGDAGGSDVSPGDGGCVDEIVATDDQGATALALDGDIVFWGTPDGFVRTRDAEHHVQTLATEGGSIASIAVDANYVYYALTGAVRRVPRAGGAVTDVATGVGEPFALSISPSPSGASGQAVYYVNYGAGILAGSAHALPLAGGDVTLIEALDTPGGLGVDDNAVYVTASYAQENGLTYASPLFRVDKHALSFATLATSLHQPGSVTVFGGRVYFVEQVDDTSTLHGGVRSVGISGGPTKVEIQTDGYLPLDVAADASGVYATAYSQEDSVLDRGGAGGAPVAIASTPGAFYGVVRTSATAIYWTIQWMGAPPANHASVRKVCK